MKTFLKFDSYLFLEESEVMEENDIDSFCGECQDECIDEYGYMRTPCGCDEPGCPYTDHCFKIIDTSKHDSKIITAVMDEVRKTIEDPQMRIKLIELEREMKERAGI